MYLDSFRTIEFYKENILMNKALGLREIYFHSNLKFRGVLHENRISKLHFVWNGNDFKNLDIMVDLVICAGDVIAKQRRHMFPAKTSYAAQMLYLTELLFNPSVKLSQNQSLARSTHKIELNLMNKLSKAVKRGYILAKAVRLAAIAKPKNLEWYDLA